MITKLPRISWMPLLATIALLPATLFADTRTTETVVSGVDQTLLEASLDPSDMKIVLEHLLNSAVFDTKDYKMKHEHITYSDEDALLAAVDSKSVDMFVMFTTEYLKYKDRDMEPVACLSSSGESQDTYFIMSKGDGTRPLADYRGESIIIYAAGPREMVDMWLRVELIRAGLPEPEAFFGSIEYVTKMSKAVTPVYFGKATLCLVHDKGLEAMAVLNPQIARKLKPVVVSPPLLQGLLCMRRSLDPEKRARMLNGVLSLNTSVAGTQILRFARVDKILEISGRDIAATEALYEEYTSYQGGSLQVTATPAGNDTGQEMEVRSAIPLPANSITIRDRKIPR
ncbi:MAG: PhnD/SsuA/transferrin family substrate-binding protein [Verrucomicrobiales bacterium]